MRALDSSLAGEQQSRKPTSPIPLSTGASEPLLWLEPAGAGFYHLKPCSSRLLATPESHLPVLIYQSIWSDVFLLVSLPDFEFLLFIFAQGLEQGCE